MTSQTIRQALGLERTEDGVRLTAPEAGIFTAAQPRGAALAPGQFAGSLLVLRHECELFVPEGVWGIVKNARPERVHEPVGYGQVLYELAPIGAEGMSLEAEADEAAGEEGLVVRSPQSGRFYHRPSPDAELFAAVGSVLEPGTPIGLIEVMKTFTHIPYQATGGLPVRARVVRVIAGDGADVSSGEALLEVEPA